MRKFSIRDKCKVNTNYDTDTFVGVKCDNKDISIHFPLGFAISDDDKELRKEILLLINTIGIMVGRKDSELQGNVKNYNYTTFPFRAYIAVIYDFYTRGYYKEKEAACVVAKKGKIDWGRTIKTQKPYIQNSSAFYLDFVVKKNSINNDELITLIHEYCVYESFFNVGWLFTNNLPPKPKLKYNEKLFRRVLTDKISHTFNDRSKELFRNLLAIVNYQVDRNAPVNYCYGTYRFEYVWEALIDRAYGIENKELYFPKTAWKIKELKYDNASLEPDTIMLYNGNVYVIDAKYYKYGTTKQSRDLPESTSINKQITYGEYIAEQEKFKKIHGEKFMVYNVFLLPFNASLWEENEFENIKYIGTAISSWKTNEKSYEKIYGILVDVKHLMKTDVRLNLDEMEKLAQLIEMKRK